MKAISFDPQQVKPVLKEWNIPEPANGEVLIKIKAAGLNHRDLHITNPRNTNEFIYGSDGAGVMAGR
jgi:zinc-binding alcohol dehydrogenase/oxidoreductase